MAKNNFDKIIREQDLRPKLTKERNVFDRVIEKARLRRERPVYNSQYPSVLPKAPHKIFEWKEKRHD